VGGFDPNCVRTPTQNHDIAPSKQFMQEGEKPFCLVIALVEPHVPWVMGDPSQYPEDQLKLPPHIADTAVTRNAFSRYLAEITYMDGQVGEILQALEETGKADDTMVLFTSEQGAQFPGCKWTNWDLGLHTALIARWPGKTPTNQRTDAIVQYADVLPTLVDIAGGKPANHNYDGTSFQEVLKAKPTPTGNMPTASTTTSPKDHPIRSAPSPMANSATSATCVRMRSTSRSTSWASRATAG